MVAISRLKRPPERSNTVANGAGAAIIAVAFLGLGCPEWRVLLLA